MAAVTQDDVVVAPSSTLSAPRHHRPRSGAVPSVPHEPAHVREFGSFACTHHSQTSSSAAANNSDNNDHANGAGDGGDGGGDEDGGGEGGEGDDDDAQNTPNTTLEGEGGNGNRDLCGDPALIGAVAGGWLFR